jgi:catechol 2,3-dioxygenase-like lactoylglutathione lyase family enzyme
MSTVSRREFQLLLGLGLVGMTRMARAAAGDRPQLDHIVFLVPNLEAAMDRFEAMTGVRPLSGGVAPGRAASHNALVGLGGGSYLEVFSPDRAMTSGVWLDEIHARPEPHIGGFCMRVEGGLDDLAKATVAAGLTGAGPREMGRKRPDGVTLNWKLYNVDAPLAGPTMPFFIDWLGSPHPSADSPQGCKLTGFGIGHPNPDEMKRIFTALKIDAPVTQAAKPTITAQLDTPNGVITLTS